MTNNFAIRKVLFICLCLCFFYQQSKAQKHPAPLKIVIDAGHGGKDPGKPRGSSRHMHEKDINLSIAKLLAKEIKDNIPNVKVIFTRTKDVYVTLEERVNIANNAKADIFLSIHCNSNPNRWIAGTKTHIQNHQNKKSSMFAYLAEQEMANKGGRKSRGIMTAYDRGFNLYVLKFTEMPGILVECGFLSNPYEQKYLNSSNGQLTTAKSLCSTLQKFINLYYKNRKSIYTYRVQVMASSKQIPLDSSYFKKITYPVKEIKMRGNGDEKYYFKYMVGEESSLSRATALKEKVKKLGFKDAFIVKFK